VIPARLLHHLPAVLLLLAGIAIAWTGSSYRVGALTAMGPGFMPVALGCCLALLAVALFWLERPHEQDVEHPLLRPVLCVGTGMVAWALVVDSVGFIPAGLLQLLLSSLALPGQQWRRVVFGSLLLTLAAYVLFVKLLGMPLAAFGS
jgi:hypothetical protein